MNNNSFKYNDIECTYEKIDDEFITSIEAAKKYQAEKDCLINEYSEVSKKYTVNELERLSRDLYEIIEKLQTHKRKLLKVQDIITHALNPKNTWNGNEKQEIEIMASLILNHISRVGDSISKVENKYYAINNRINSRKDKKTLFLSIMLSVALSIISIVISLCLDNKNTKDTIEFRNNLLNQESIINLKLDTIYDNTLKIEGSKNTLEKKQ